MHCEEQFGRLDTPAMLYTVELRELFDLVRRIIHIVAADLAEQNLPLAEERLRLRMVGRGDRFVERADAVLRELGISPKVAREIFGRERLALLPQIEQCPQETLGRVAVDLDRLLHLPLLVAEADEDEMIPVQPDAEQAVERLAELRAHVVEAFLDLLDDLAAAQRVSFWADA